MVDSVFGTDARFDVWAKYSPERKEELADRSTEVPSWPLGSTEPIVFHNATEGRRCAAEELLATSRVAFGSDARYVEEFQKALDMLQNVAHVSPDALTNSIYIAETRTQTKKLADDQAQTIATLKLIILQLQQSNSSPTCSAMPESESLPSSIAGHPRKIISQGWCECGVLWSKLRYATKDCIGQPGYAHQGALNEKELREVDAEVEREAGRISAAMADLGGGLR